jgi:hypothetical protein
MTRSAVLAVLAAAVLVLAACGDTDEGTGSTSGDDTTGVVLTVFVADEPVAEWTLDRLRDEVEFVSLEIDGDDQSGPRLLDVLTASGIDDWETAEVLGMGEGRSFEVGLTISASEVDDGWMLDVTNRGTLKLAAAGLSREQWVRDVGEIRIP